MKIRSKLINLCQKVAHVINILCVTIIFLAVSIIVTGPIALILIYRLCLSKCVRVCDGKKLTKILTSGATMFAADNVTDKPNLNVVSMMTLKGKGIEVKELQNLFQEKVLNLKTHRGQFKYPEFKQFYYRFMGFLFFSPEVDFQIENHIRYYDYSDLDLPRSDNKFCSIYPQDLCRIKPNLMSRGWPVGTSPWEFLIVPNYVEPQDEDDSESGTVLIFRFHHGLGDGLIFLNILWNCLAANGDEITSHLPSPCDTQHSFLYYLTLPFRIHFDYIRQFVESNDENPWKISENELLSAGVESAMTGKISFSLIRQIRSRLNVTSSSVLMAAVAGALRKTMLDNHVHIPLAMHALVPIPRRIDRNNKLRNYLSILYTRLPVGTKDCGRRIVETDSHFKKLKNSTLPLANGLCHQIAGSLTYPLVRFLQKNVLATVLLSNVPMPPTTCYFLGNKMTDVTFSTSCHGNNGIRISIISYNASLRISVDVSKALPPKCSSIAGQIVANIETELKNMNNMDTLEIV